jgi:hypothetical protein
MVAPTRDECAIAELADGYGGEKELVAGHETDLGHAGP